MLSMGRRTVSHTCWGVPNAHRLAPHIHDAEPISWFGPPRPRRGGARSSLVGFLIGLLGGGGIGLLAQTVARGF